MAPGMDAPLSPGLYIVATPIGNLGDMTLRGAETLRSVAAIACEDTRVTGKLLNHLGIKTRMIRYDDHASDNQRDGILALAQEQPVALVSDAGTPLISDPGFKLVREARARGIAVTSLPGANAAVVALTLSGLPTDRFLFAGFLPNKSAARRAFLEELRSVRSTLVLFETGPRLKASLADMADVLGPRPAAVARELTKLYETCIRGSLPDLAADPKLDAPKGEIVVVIGPGEVEAASEADAEAALASALERLGPADAASEVAKALGLNRRELYRRALAIQGRT